jgi:trimeric autotransporter adhesin
MKQAKVTGVEAGAAAHLKIAKSTALRRFGSLALFFAALTSMAFSQEYRGTINGTVTDQTGAVVVGAQVQVIDENTHFVSPTTTNSDGLFTVPFLTPDTYDVKVEAKGFATAEQLGVVLNATDIKQVNLTVKPATTASTVTVTENQQLLQTESPTVESVLSSNELHNAPNLGGTIYMMATRVAGVYSNFTQGPESSQWWPVGGGVSGTTFEGLGGGQLVTMNGIEIMPPEGNPGAYTGYLPPAIGVQELNVETSTMDAEIGHTNGGVENSVLKTGTSKLHAEASFLYGDTIFNSNAYQLTALGDARVPDNWIQPSFVATGPVIIPKLYSNHGKQKTFFMVAYEHLDYTNAGNTAIGASVPTAKERTGDFSELSNATGAINGTANQEGLIYDPTTTVPSGALGTYAAWCSPTCAVGTRESFNQEYNEGPGANYIPSSRFNPTGAILLKYWPSPTSAGNPTKPGTGDFTPVSQLAVRYWQWFATFSVDHEFNENNKVTVAFLPYTWYTQNPNFTYPVINGYGGGPGYFAYRKDWGALIDYTLTLSPTMVLNLRTGGLYHPLVILRPGNGMPLTDLGMTGNTLSFPQPNFPAINATGPFGGYNGLTSGASNFANSTIDDNTAVLSKSFNKHSLKTGFEYLAEETDPDSPVSSFAGTGTTTAFSFDNTFTRETVNTTAGYANGGDGIAALLLGYNSGGAASIVPSPAYEWNYWAGFVQDDWRLASKLVLNLGFRYDYLSPFTERHNRLEAGFDFSSANPFNIPNATGTAIASANVPPASAALPQGYHGGLYYVNSSEWQSRLYYRRELLDRWQPRIGASYHMFPNTVLRGGWGLFFGPSYPGPDNTGFSSSTSTIASTNGNYTPPACTSAQGADAYGFCNMTNPYPSGYVQPTNTMLGLSTGLGGAVTFAGPSWLPVRDYIWTAGLEQQLPFQTMVDIEYHGNRADGLGVSKNWNALPNCYYVYGSGCPNAGNATALSAPVANPMAGYMPASSGLNAATTPQSNLYLPYPEFTSITQSTDTQVDGTNQRVGWHIDNALYLTATKRISHGLEARAAFTYQHIENRQTLLNAGDPVTSPFKVDDSGPNRYLVGDLTYRLPEVNVGHAFGYVLNGWEWDHSLNWQSGIGIAVPGSAFSTGISPVTHHKSLTHMFNTCYIPVVYNIGQVVGGVTQTSVTYGPPTDQSGAGKACQYGEQPAWIQQPTQTLNQISGPSGGFLMRDVRTPEIPYYDMAVKKSIPIHEGLDFSLRAEFHNVFNMDCFGCTGGPTNTLTSTAVGSYSPAATVNGKAIYSETNDPRIIRFETRLSF